MKITALETIRLEEFANLLWLKVHTTEGLVGLGETFFHPATVVFPPLTKSNLAGDPVIVDAGVWGSGEIRAHHIWWTSLLPHITGGNGGVAYNWWKYIVDPNTVR